jgi:hypothetical protein
MRGTGLFSTSFRHIIVGERLRRSTGNVTTVYGDRAALCVAKCDLAASAPPRVLVTRRQCVASSRIEKSPRSIGVSGSAAQSTSRRCHAGPHPDQAPALYRAARPEVRRDVESNGIIVTVGALPGQGRRDTVATSRRSPCRGRHALLALVTQFDAVR